jgi:SAM-dependent methyltransferase
MLSDQGNIFKNFEGDRWFQRNRDGLRSFDPQQDLPLKTLNLYDLQPKTVLEIGASNGFRLACMNDVLGCRATAVEASAQAVEDGQRRYPDVQFIRAEAHSIPLHETYDLVIVNFVLHWVDRNRILPCVAEMDRLTKNGGHILIGDFFPSCPGKTPYHHLPEHEVYTYKQDYAEILLASGFYKRVCCLTAGHADKQLRTNVPENERVAVHLLEKNLYGLYQTATE